MGGRVTSKLIGAVVVLVMASCAPPDESMTGLQIDADDIGHPSSSRQPDAQDAGRTHADEDRAHDRESGLRDAVTDRRERLRGDPGDVDAPCPTLPRSPRPQQRTPAAKRAHVVYEPDSISVAASLF